MLRMPCRGQSVDEDRIGCSSLMASERTLNFGFSSSTSPMRAPLLQEMNTLGMPEKEGEEERRRHRVCVRRLLRHSRF
jgi:hypothetical protein